MTGVTAAPLRLGVLDLHAIQYHAPLYRLLAERGKVALDVLYLRDWGAQPVFDPSFGVQLAWDIDLLGGYEHDFLHGTGRDGKGSLGTTAAGRLGRLVRWIRAHDVVVLYGHSDRWMLAAAAASRAVGVPYLLRGDAGPDGRSAGPRRHLRGAVARAVVSASAGGLAVGQLNADFYRKYAAPRITFAPHSVDDKRFTARPATDRAELLARHGLDPARPVVMFCGKLQPRKRPLDLLAAVGLLGREVSTLFVGDGELASRLRAGLQAGRGTVTGFVNQADIPSYYHAADILVLPSEHEPWGLVVNEAMLAGALPVVSDRVGCARDLVMGTGHVYPCGDTTALALAVRRALDSIATADVRPLMRQRAARYGVVRTAAGFEHASMSARSVSAAA